MKYSLQKTARNSALAVVMLSASFGASLMTPLSAHTMTPAIAQATPISWKEMPSGEYRLDPAHASLIWKVNHIGLSNYTARFTKFDASFTFDAENPSASVITAKIDPSSIETDFPFPEKKDFDTILSSDKKWFNASEFPAIEFQSTQLEMIDDKNGKLTGDLTFLGTKKPVTLNVTFNGAYESAPFSNVPAMGFSATTTIERSEWSLGTYVPAIGDQVEIIIEAEFHKQ